MTLISRVLLPFLLLIYIAIETYLKLNHSSLCNATGCKLAGELLRFNPIYLNYVGIAAVTLLSIVGILSLKNKMMEKFFFIILYGAVAFEATILGYQFLVNPEPCIFCMGIFSSLLLIGLLSDIKNFLRLGAVAFAVFIGLSTLAVSKNKAFLTEQKTYLIYSETCPHCHKVMDYFKEHQIAYTPISVREASARNFLKFAGITSIPVMIDKSTPNILMLVGDHDIITHYKHSDTIENKPATENTNISQSSPSYAPVDIFKAASEPGCAITITEVPDCEKKY